MRIDWENVRVRLNCAGRVRWEPGVEVSSSYDKNAPVNDHTIVQFWAGRGRLVTQKNTVDLRPGMCLWKRRGGGYDLRQDPKRPIGVTFLHFDLLDNAGQLLPSDAPLPPEVLHPTNASYTETVARRIVEIVFGGGMGYAWVPNDGSMRTTANAMLTGLLMDLDRGAGPALFPGLATQKPGTKAQLRQTEQMMQLVSTMIETQDKLPTVAELARRAGYSQSHFSRIFRGIVDHGARDFLIQVRIARASSLLLHSSLSIGQIADTLGYRDIFHFSKQFKQKTSQTPTAFRRRGVRWDEPMPGLSAQRVRKSSTRS